MSRALTHCAALALRPHTETFEKTPSAAGSNAVPERKNYELGGYTFSILSEQTSVGVALAIADGITSIACRHVSFTSNAAVAPVI